MPYSRPSRLVYSQIPRGAHPANRTTLGSYRFRIAFALIVTVAYTAFLYRSGALEEVLIRPFRIASFRHTGSCFSFPLLCLISCIFRLDGGRRGSELLGWW
jgi:hypothetical protein